MEQNLKLLTTVSRDTDADIILSRLGSENIIGIKKYNEHSAAAKLYCGESLIGVDIYVWTSAYDKALELISDCSFPEDELAELAENSVEAAPPDNSGNLAGKIICYTLILIILFVILYYISK